MRTRLLVLALALWPLSASAANGMRPRTAANFGDVACMQTLAPGDVMHVDYSVALDDTDLTDDELPDSRTQQFFAFSRQHYDFKPPTWITDADFDRAEANGDVMQNYGPEDVLETSPDWPAGTWVRITPDDARVPITMAQAAMGFDWDTTGAAPGTWLVWGYTWEPEQNLWSLRLGAVRIEDPADPGSAGPSLFLDPPDAPFAMRGETFDVPGCIVAPEGSTVTAYWGDIIGIDEPAWVPFAEDVPVSTGALALTFDPPDAAGASLRLRVDITDPDGRTYTAYSPYVLGVTGTPTGDGEGSGADDGGGDDGGGCRTGSTPRSSRGAALLLLLLLAPFARRRRR